MESKTHEELILEVKKLTEQINEKNTELKNKNLEIKNLENIIENKDLIINQLQRYVFGSKSETIKKEENIVKGEQCCIFSGR